jgi:hypothetical protein
MSALDEFKKTLITALRERRITEQKKIELETEYCYVQVYTPMELPKYIRKVVKELRNPNE